MHSVQEHRSKTRGVGTYKFILAEQITKKLKGD